MCPFCSARLAPVVVAAALALLVACGKEEAPKPRAGAVSAVSADASQLVVTPQPTRLDVLTYAPPVPPYGVPPAPRPPAALLPGSRVSVYMNGSSGVVVSEGGKKLGVTPFSAPLTLGPHTLDLEYPSLNLRTTTTVNVNQDATHWNIVPAP